VICIFHKI